ncbi:Hypothetical predicted protein [Cloeon dipterum]|uniref:Pro-resilin n=1 Tax=Cloeon dipterum TaxID=197152 RepID=A0A8S1DY73_9INSE|nr:Hypothetical predicted protein [Cloeon dipterum]
MKVFVVLSALCVATLAEAPLGHMHAPTAHAPSSNYGAPSRGLTDARFNEFGSRTSSYQSRQQQSYSNSQDDNSYDAPSTSYGAPSTEYGAPSDTYGPPSDTYGPPSDTYGPPSEKYDSLDRKYGAPKSNSYQQSRGPPAPRYNAPTPAPFSDSYSRRTEQSADGPYPGALNDDASEPASYEFKYEVNDAASGQEFGHMESREGDVVTGEYRVLLPDGRTQVVKYIADKNGYRPTIEYLEANQGGPY